VARVRQAEISTGSEAWKGAGGDDAAHLIAPRPPFRRQPADASGQGLARPGTSAAVSKRCFARSCHRQQTAGGTPPGRTTRRQQTAVRSLVAPSANGGFDGGALPSAPSANGYPATLLPSANGAAGAAGVEGGPAVPAGDCRQQTGPFLPAADRLAVLGPSASAATAPPGCNGCAAFVRSDLPHFLLAESEFAIYTRGVLPALADQGRGISPGSASFCRAVGPSYRWERSSFFGAGATVEGARRRPVGRRPP
jgi:hypothetical protein